jgi:mannobiose 2-epimerase
MKFIHSSLFIFIIAFPLIATAAEPPTPETYRKINTQVLSNLHTQILDKWFPRAIDEQNGGFNENFRDDWSPAPAARQDQRSIVYQSRLTWLSAAAALRFPNDAAKYLKITRHGIQQLAGKQWDHQHGGFFWSVDTTGKPLPNNGSEKHAYGNAFGIYASAESYRANHDPAALDLAKKAFAWLDDHAHDADHGGYYEALTVDGKPILAPPANGPAVDSIGTQYGQKSMNTHIHLLEALTTLHEVWPDDTVTQRTREVFNIILTKVYAEPGFQHMFFKPDWTPIPGVDSYGHDIETGYLLVEAATALGMPDDPHTWTAARHLVDHGMSVGFDQTHGGFYDSGTVDGKNLKKEKIWWVEAEGLNALLLMHSKFGKDDPKYFNAFAKQWDFISTHQIDPTHGGWYPTVSEDGTPPANRPKSDRWTEGYHQGRAMLNVSKTLEELARK